MKKQIITLLLVCAVLFATAVSAWAGGSKEKGKTYTIGTDTSFAPFVFQDNKGHLTGIDVDLMAAIAKDQKITCNLKPMAFSAALTALVSGKVDGVIAGMSITEERKSKYDFSDSYYDANVIIILAVSANDNTIAGYEDLRGKQVATKHGTEGAAFAASIREQYGFELVYFEESNPMYEAVLAGNVVACFEDYLAIAFHVGLRENLKMIVSHEQNSSYGFAVLKGKNEALLGEFNEGLKNIRADGTYQKILDKYIKIEAEE